MIDAHVLTKVVLMLTNHCFAFPVCLPLYVEE